MKKDIYRKIVYWCLALLAILPLFNAFNLTWKEILRLLVITCGLLYLYLKYRKRLLFQKEDKKKGNAKYQKWAGSLLALVYMFIITQFDPATGAIDNIAPQNKLNWFFVVSSALIFVSFGACMFQRNRGTDQIYVESYLDPTENNGDHKGSSMGREENFNSFYKYLFISGSIIISIIIILNHPKFHHIIFLLLHQLLRCN